MASAEAAGQDFSLRAGLKAIYARMSARRRRQLLLVLVLMSVGAIAELATIGAVIPFLALLANSAEAREPKWLSLLRPISFGWDPLVVAATAFILIAVIAGVVRLLLARTSRNFIFRLGHDLTVEIQRRVLFQPFSFHIHRNTSSLLAALSKNEVLVFDMLLPLMHGVTSGVIAMVIVVMLLFINPVITLSVSAAFALTYALISVATRKRLAANSVIMDTAFDERLQVVQESLGGIRDVILDNAQTMYLREFAAIDIKLASARATNQFISAAPRYLIEMVGMVVIAAIALLAARQSGGIAAALPVLGALALGGQRLLPLVQDVYAGWSTLEGQRSVFGQVIELLCLPVRHPPAKVPAPFELRRSIRLDGVSFTYPTRNRPALDQVNLQIPRGATVALVGATGSGKSTLVDVLMGLLRPGSGQILIDDIPLTETNQRQWHRSVAHVPQAIFLADATIARNIALSLPDTAPDHERIVDAAKKAQLHEFIISLPGGYDTFVGERGIRLSGGQRQRLGLARAIYKQAPVLVLDEATSALDELTEKAVIAALENLRREGRTIIIVAHRLSTIRHSDFVARLERGKVVDFGPFAEVVGARESLS
jgi:ATP-binding cassette subfamily B protein